MKAVVVLVLCGVVGVSFAQNDAAKALILSKLLGSSRLSRPTARRQNDMLPGQSSMNAIASKSGHPSHNTYPVYPTTYPSFPNYPMYPTNNRYPQQRGFMSHPAMRFMMMDQMMDIPDAMKLPLMWQAFQT